ncbi:MAG: DNA mismatch repair protein MutS, partial [Ginsengibacter sp.]
MKLFPSSAIQQLEFDKIQNLLASHCRTEFSKQRAANLRIHTRKEFIEPELQQTHEYKLLYLNHLHFPDDTVFNLSKELKLLSIE